jgi:hypothetical protein
MKLLVIVASFKARLTAGFYSKSIIRDHAIAHL